jgi:CRP-like cAMP-binding protein
MKSFEPGFIERQTIPHGLLSTVRLIGEYKGKQDLYRKQSPQVLETLQQAAVIQSTESSNRIEGVTAPLERIRELVEKRTALRMVQDAVMRLPRNFKVSDVERACPGTSRPTINRALAELRREGKIRSVKRGRDAVWERVEETH